ncbi:MAG TPA: hypothetical protein VJ840_18745 [Gemmatimonadaceae bacterium]|nr:hypothetical protein [Gemmatimonadaceae bacterium]
MPANGDVLNQLAMDPLLNVAAGNGTALTAGPGTAGTAVVDVGAAFSQATLNNNFATITAKLNLLLSILNADGITNP